MCIQHTKKKLTMNDIFKKNLILILFLQSFMTPATPAACSRDISNKSCLTGLQITMGLVGATAVLVTATGLWFAKSSGKKVQNIEGAKREASTVDREISRNQTLSSAQKQQAHNNNILELAKARVHFEKYKQAYSFALAHKPLGRISVWDFLKIVGSKLSLSS